MARLYVYILVPPSLALPPCVSAGCPWRQGGRTSTPLAPLQLAATTTYQCSLLRLSAGRSALPVQQPVYTHKQNMMITCRPLPDRAHPAHAPPARRPTYETPQYAHRSALEEIRADSTACTQSVSVSGPEDAGRAPEPRALRAESEGRTAAWGRSRRPGASHPPVCTRREAQNARGRQHHGIHQTYICERL